MKIKLDTQEGEGLGTHLKLYEATIASHRAIYEACGIGEEAQRKMFRDTAARLLGLD